MPKRTKLNQHISNGDIYRQSLISMDSLPTTPKILLEFIEDCELDIGYYLTIDREQYPKILKSKGDIVYAFLDNTRNGYCFDHIINETMISIFIPKPLTRPIII